MIEQSEMRKGIFPLVTVVMPIRDEVKFIEHSLDAVFLQDYPSDRLEIIVADGMSQDGTQEVVADLQSAHPNLRLIANPKQIMPSGANAAIKQTQGEIILLLGGHTEIPSDYIRLCVECLIENEADCVGGAVESIGDGYIGEVIAVAMSSPFGVGGSDFRTADNNTQPISTDTVPFGAYRRGVFERIGLFNEEMVRHQDYEFHYRLRKSGGKILLLPSLKATYYVRSTLPALWRQYWQYGLWKGRFLRRYPDSLKLRHLIPPLFMLAVLASGLLAMISDIGLWSLGFVLSAYFIFLLAATTKMTLNGRLKYAPVLPVVLICLHISWGLGVWAGLLLPKLPNQKSEVQNRR
jgi:succinoglycan biosynthesis protein ExoA